MINLQKIFYRKQTDNQQSVLFHKSKIKKGRFQEINVKYKDVDPYPGFSKYLDRDRHIQVALNHYKQAGLEGKSGLSILDIGSGAGYFPFICANFGHSVEALDVPDNDFYREMIDLLGVVRHEHCINAFEKLPAMGQKFDVITAFAVCFNAHATNALWGIKEWEFFLSDLRENKVKPGAELFLKLNKEPSGQFYSEELRKYFESLGAVIDHETVKIPL